MVKAVKRFWNTFRVVFGWMFLPVVVVLGPLQLIHAIDPHRAWTPYLIALVIWVSVAFLLALRHVVIGYDIDPLRTEYAIDAAAKGFFRGLWGCLMWVIAIAVMAFIVVGVVGVVGLLLFGIRQI